jgi:hypothetical protein
MTYTSGPWSFYCEEGMFDSWIVQNDGDNDSDRVICRMERNKRIKHTDKRKAEEYRIAAEEVANARLMSCSPELLEMVECLRGIIAEKPYQSDNEALHVLLRQCDDLIAKAKGE